MADPSQDILSKITAGGGGGGSFLGLSMWGLLAGLVFSTIGYFYFRAGKANSNFTTLGTGIALMVFPYFITNTLYVVAVGIGIMVLHYFTGDSD